MDVPAIIDGKAPTSPAAWLANVSAHGERDGDQAPAAYRSTLAPAALAIRGEVSPEEPDRDQVNASTVRRWLWMPARSSRPGPLPGAGVASRSAAPEGRDRDPLEIGPRAGA